MRKLILFSALMLASMNGWAATELVQNGGFETGSLGPWTVTSDCGTFGDAPCSPWAVTSPGAHSGTYAASAQGGYELMQSLTPTSTALITSASFWFKEDPGVIFGVELFYQDGSNSVFFGAAPDAGWNQYDLLGSLTGGETLIAIDIATGSMFNGPNGINAVDDVSIMAIPTLNGTVPEPSTILLVAGGVAAAVSKKLRYRSMRMFCQS
jgi:hypothetical protein